MATQAERTAATTSKLIETAIKLFTDKGFANTSNDDIATAAGVTRGALYHHFADKRDLFIAAFDQLQQGFETASRKVGSFSKDGDPIEVFIKGCRLYLDVCSRDRAVVRIVLMDGPTVIGPETWYQLDAAYADASLGRSLRRLEEVGAIRQGLDLTVIAVMINGALNDAALWLAQTGAKKATLDRAEAALRALVGGLKP